MDPVASRGIALFNSGRFFEAHEAFEDLWRAASGPERRALQGLIQICAGLTKHRRGLPGPAASLLAKGLANLEAAPPARLPHVDGEHLAVRIRGVLDAVESGRPFPAPSLRPTHGV